MPHWATLLLFLGGGLLLAAAVDRFAGAGAPAVDARAGPRPRRDRGATAFSENVRVPESLYELAWRLWPWALVAAGVLLVVQGMRGRKGQGGRRGADVAVLRTAPGCRGFAFGGRTAGAPSQASRDTARHSIRREGAGASPAPTPFGGRPAKSIEVQHLHRFLRLLGRRRRRATGRQEPRGADEHERRRRDLEREEAGREAMIAVEQHPRGIGRGQAVDQTRRPPGGSGRSGGSGAAGSRARRRSRGPAAASSGRASPSARRDGSPARTSRRGRRSSPRPSGRASRESGSGPPPPGRVSEGPGRPTARPPHRRRPGRREGERDRREVDGQDERVEPAFGPHATAPIRPGPPA